ncbi:MAG: hypothetical protein L0H55_07565 [Candidatus Nitrosocosmicus sp.]|nr:hypothetical protein [Candidatus Nitrosocosmicus sp.]
MLNFSRKNYRSNYLFITLGIFTILLISVPGSVFASSNSPYDSGYDHGCDDAGISDSSDRYINQPEKGPSYHTSEFMNGYNDGVNSCSSSNNDNNERFSSPSPSSRSQPDCTMSEAIGGGICALAGEMVAPGIGGFVTGPIGSNIGKNMCENQ